MEPVDVAELFSEVVRFETELWDIVDRKLQELYNLPLTRFEPMQVIERTPGCRVNDIAEALSITVGGTSKLVDRIESAGFCLRRRDPEDGRSSILELTPAGRELLSDAARTFRDVLGEHLESTVPQEDLQQFMLTIQKLRQILRKKRE